MSLLFYTWGGASFLIWLVGSISINWLLGLVAQRAHDDGKQWTTNFAIFGSALVNIGLLSWFKYANFVFQEINVIINLFDMPGQIDWTNIALPIGISFFTFQSLSYVIDVARGTARAQRNPLNFALYVSLFPQLIAGPIVRYHEIEAALLNRSFSTGALFSGIVRFTHGLCKKVLIADSAGYIADLVFGGTQTPVSLTDAWIGVLAYTVQIYFDFSGYSDMAIGLGRMFGFNFPENFRRPYSATSITDFWRRWHITLSSWFRDYVYIPLGGSHYGNPKTYRNLFIVFFLTGIWHGAAWNFLIWGMYHGLWLIYERGSERNSLDQSNASYLRILAKRSSTLLIVMVGWVLFRVSNMSDAFAIYNGMLGLSGFRISAELLLEFTTYHLIALLVGIGIFFAGGKSSLGQLLDQKDNLTISVLRLSLVAVGFPFAVVQLVSGSYSPFLYFRF